MIWDLFKIDVCNYKFSYKYVIDHINPSISYFHYHLPLYFFQFLLWFFKLIHWFLGNVLFSICMFVNVSTLPVISTFIQLQLDTVHFIISVLLNYHCLFSVLFLLISLYVVLCIDMHIWDQVFSEN